MGVATLKTPNGFSITFDFDNTETLIADRYRDAHEAVDRAMVGEVLRQTSGNLSRAAQLLRINRATLTKRAKKYGLVE